LTKGRGESITVSGGLLFAKKEKNSAPVGSENDKGKQKERNVTQQKNKKNKNTNSYKDGRGSGEGKIPLFRFDRGGKGPWAKKSVRGTEKGFFVESVENAARGEGLVYGEEFVERVGGLCSCLKYVSKRKVGVGRLPVCPPLSPVPVPWLRRPP